MKIALTGMTGFVGAAIAKRLFHGQDEVIGFVRDKRSVPLEIQEKFTVIACDFKKKIPNFSCDLLINCAADTNQHTMSPLLNHTNVQGLENLLNSIERPCNMVHLSCSHVYNLQNEDHIENESIQYGLLDSYGRSKLDSEKLLLQQSEKVSNLAILRPALVYGMGGQEWIQKLHSIYQGGRVMAPGEMEIETSLCHIDTLVDFILQLSRNFVNGLEVINVADQKNYVVKKVVKDLINGLYKEDINWNQKNELFSRILAGFHTVMKPGSRLSQSYIDFFTKRNTLSTEIMQQLSPGIQNRNYFEELPSIIEWINNVGLQKILKKNYMIPWV